MAENRVEGGARGRYIDKLPSTLLQKLFEGHWLPIVGAGLSATASTDDGQSPPTWAQLAESLRQDLRQVRPRSGPIEVVSAYADLFGRAGLVERLTEVLLVDRLEPGPAHAAFSRLPFDVVVTTNVDFLLEEAYREARRPCVPLVGELQLSIARRAQATHLLMFHGDLRHPQDLIMTEDDYDGFLRRKPLLATCLASWLLTRETVLIGYSLDDADLRDVLALLRERLGQLARPGWAIVPTDDEGGQVAAYLRRGLNAIVLDRDPPAGVDRYQHKADVLRQFFEELRDAWEDRVRQEMTARTDAISAELQRA